VPSSSATGEAWEKSKGGDQKGPKYEGEKRAPLVGQGFRRGTGTKKEDIGSSVDVAVLDTGNCLKMARPQQN